ncbi:MAG: alpha-L-fucosidase [Rikenellaceae bacterium]
MKKLSIIVTLSLAVATLLAPATMATPQEEQIRKEALAEWQKMKFGLFIHWGIYSIPAGVWDGKQIELLGEQIQRHANIPHEEYMALAKEFNPVNFDADAIVSMAKNAGMKYVVLTTKHHDGFCMFESKYTDFDIVDATPYKKDILMELAEACRKGGLKLGLYYSTPDWHFNHPNVEINPTDNKISVFGKVSKANEDYQVKQLEELMSNYGDIVELFFDMGEPTAAQSNRFAQTVHSLQPKCVINGRIMNNEGDFITMPDNHVPDLPVDSLAWETPGTFYHTWGYKSWVSGKGDPLPVQIKKQVRNLSLIVARGGNFLLNIGPKADGSVVQYEADIIGGIGEWMKSNREAIDGVAPTPFVHLPWGEATRLNNRLYLHIHTWPEDNKLLIPGLESDLSQIFALGSEQSPLPYCKSDDGYVVDLSSMKEDQYLTVLAVDFLGELNIVDPITMASGNGLIELCGEDAIHHGKYGRESYRSILKDYYRSWDVEIPESGAYEVTISYKMSYDDKRFSLSAGAATLDFTLTGSNAERAKAELIDGNETSEVKAETAPQSTYITKVVGVVNLDKSDREVVYLRQGEEFEMKATTEEFMAQDHKYRTMNLDVESITFKRVE